MLDSMLDSLPGSLLYSLPDSMLGPMPDSLPNSIPDPPLNSHLAGFSRMFLEVERLPPRTSTDLPFPLG